MFWKRRTYLDYAAGVAGNPSSPHEEGRRAKKMLEDARTAIARLIEVQTDDVIFTSGATESNALAILGTVRSRQKAVGSRKLHVLYLPSQHASVVENIKLLAQEGVAAEELPISAGGGSASGGKNYRVDTETLVKMIRPETVLVSMDAVCGETGVIWNTREVAQTIRSTSRKSSFLAPSGPGFALGQPVAEKITFSPCLHIDASQAPLTQKIPRAHFDADMLTLDGSKVGAARGIGALIVHRTIPMVPLYKGGGQERALRPGSEAPELAKSFAAALCAAARDREIFRVNAEQARAQLIKAITLTIPNVSINEGRYQAPHILNLSLPGRDTDYLVALLDEAGFAVSTRSACETDSEEGSRAIFALTGDQERALSTLRISWGPSTQLRDIVRVGAALTKAVAFLDKGLTNRDE